MRTTVSLPDALLARAKRRAEEENLTLSDVVAAALTDHLSQRSAAEPAVPFRLVTYGRGGLRDGLSYDRLKDVADDEAAERLSASRSPVRRAGDDAGP